MATEPKRLRIPFWVAMPLYVFCGACIAASIVKGYPALAILFAVADIAVFAIRIQSFREGYYE